MQENKSKKEKTTFSPSPQNPDELTESNMPKIQTNEIGYNEKKQAEMQKNRKMEIEKRLKEIQLLKKELQEKEESLLSLSPKKTKKMLEEIIVPSLESIKD